MFKSYTNIIILFVQSTSVTVFPSHLMKYRPELTLQQLRRQRIGCAECLPLLLWKEDDRHHHTNEREDRSSSFPLLLLLRWLRTLVIDGGDTRTWNDGDELRSAKCAAYITDTLRMQQRWVLPCVVNRVVLTSSIQTRCCFVRDPLQQYIQSLPLLTALDLRSCRLWLGESNSEFNDFLNAVADCHCTTLRCLYLPRYLSDDVPQSTLDRFTMLEELDVSGCRKITNVDFCSASLRVLYANECYDLTNDGLKNATKLEVLHIQGCYKVTSVAHCLLELKLNFSRTINDTLKDCHRLQVLDAHERGDFFGAQGTLSLEPFVHRLRELRAAPGTINDAVLSKATSLVRLEVAGCRDVTTVAPFGSTLIELDACCSGIDDDGLSSATNLVILNASYNEGITSVSPFGTSLLEVDAGGYCGLNDESLRFASNIVWLSVCRNKKIRSLSSFGASLRHLVARYDWNPFRERFDKATRLVTLDAGVREKLCLPFPESLQQIVINGENDETTKNLMRSGFSQIEQTVWVRPVKLRCALCGQFSTKAMKEESSKEAKKKERCRGRKERSWRNSRKRTREA